MGLWVLQYFEVSCLVKKHIVVHAALVKILSISPSAATAEARKKLRSLLRRLPEAPGRLLVHLFSFEVLFVVD